MEHSSPKLAWLGMALAMAAAAAVVVPPCAAQNSPQDFVDLHNAARAAVGVGPVSWDSMVAAYAESYARQRAGDCKLVHSAGSPYGENLYGAARVGTHWTAKDAVDAWVAEKQYYHHDSNTCSAPQGQSCLHYTQVVWRASTKIGCARVVCNDNGIFIICSYSPPGNYVGQKPY